MGRPPMHHEFAGDRVPSGESHHHDNGDASGAYRREGIVQSLTGLTSEHQEP